MKSIGLLAVFFASFFFNVNEAIAQRYFVYDSEAFNVMLTANSDNSEIIAVSFTNEDKTEWIEFELLDYLDYEDTETGGFTYKVKDGVGSIYWIEYFRTEDYIEVYDEFYTTTWTLYRRDE